ncbi:MAG: hypothetical protein JNK14_02435 [Chitinophagaceae bacterium]|nr:hypothetical protein [Chitinophagaceae bacterium]
MPLKWKIFLALNFITAIPALILLALLIIGLTTESNRDEDYLWGSVFGAGLLFIILNNFLNILILQRHYPDRPLRSPVKTSHIILLILSALTTIGMIIVCIYAAMWVFGDENDGRDFTGKLMLIAFFAGLVLELIIIVMQSWLPAVISRHHQKKMNSLINDIGL